MTRILVIGVGAGDPDYLTQQAIRALNQVDVFFVIDKRPETRELVEMRQAICERYITGRSYRIVELDDPPRDRSSEAYGAAVDAWHSARARSWGEAIEGELGTDGCGGFLVWGDPSLYDSTIGILERVLGERPDAFEYEVIPGITSLQALAAKHRLTLNRIGGPIQITTGRQLRESGMSGDNVLVMLDGECSFQSIDVPGIEIFWGASIGTPDEALIAGDLETVSADIVQTRSEIRERSGWVMDTYLLRRTNTQQ